MITDEKRIGVGVLIRLARLYEKQLNASGMRSGKHGRLQNSLLLSVRIASGRPRVLASAQAAAR